MTSRIQKPHSLCVAIIVTACCLFTLVAGALADCGFSGGLLGIGGKIEAVLNRKKPPEVYLLGTAITVSARSQADKARNYVAPLATQLESALVNRDRRLTIEHGKPETIITCIITNLTPPTEKMENRKTTEHKKVGEQQVWNDKKKKNETQPVYKDVEVTKSYKVIDALMNVSYQVKNTKSNTQLDAANIPANFTGSYLDGNGAPTLEEVEQMLIGKAVAMIAPRLTPTTEAVKVLLPQCELKTASELGKAGLWPRMLEMLMKMPALKKPTDDAYRYYSIGLANEALAYQADDLETSKKLLDDAAENFSKAIEMKPEEKYFREPQIRIETAIAQYRKIIEQQAEYAKHLKAKTLDKQPEKAKDNSETAKIQPQATLGTPINPTGARALEPAKPQSTAMTNQQIILMVKQEVPETIILQAIKTAPSVQFDTGAQGLLDLHSSKVSEKIILLMMERQTAATKPSSAKPVPTKTRRKGR